MNFIPTHKILLKTAVLLAGSAFSTVSFAHSAGATLGADGKKASATALAAITCFDDGNGRPEGLFTQIKDMSDPVPGLLINIQLYKGLQAVSITDTVSGDADYSEGIQLNGGPGVYQMIVNKTDVGPKRFDVIWHCMTEDHTHTGTDITVRQFQ
ncbi:MAG: hypothetical protein KAJ63_06245 [Methyloprofundus sp.]|nr:hypothetical protein [Methyloprofundus sp.]